MELNNYNNILYNFSGDEFMNSYEFTENDLRILLDEEIEDYISEDDIHIDFNQVNDMSYGEWLYTNHPNEYNVKMASFIEHQFYKAVEEFKRAYKESGFSLDEEEAHEEGLALATRYYDLGDSNSNQSTIELAQDIARIEEIKEQHNLLSESVDVSSLEGPQRKRPRL